MGFHPEVMPEAQRRVLKNLGTAATGNHFYLAGGTAIAIWLGHRESIDLDWFTEDPIADPMDLAARLRAGGFGLELSSIAQGTLHGKTDEVKLSFLEYRYPLLQPLVQWPEYGCQLAALEDLAYMKLSAISSRGAKKDFIDLYAIGTTHFTLVQMLEFYQQKFETGDLLHVIASLAYFDDAEQEETPTLHWTLNWEEVKRTVGKWVTEYVRSEGSAAR
jgi:hypothetical protein